MSRDSVDRALSRWLFRNRVSVTLALALVVCGIVLGLSRTRFFEIVELNGFDRLVDVAEPPPASTQVAFVDISDVTVAQVKRWPVPRGLVAQALRRIAQGGPELIGLDMQLAEKRTEEEDRALVEALAEAGNVVVVSSRTEQGVLTEPLPEFREAALDVALVNLYLDPDGAIRRVPLGLVLQGFQRMGLAALLVQNYLGAPLKRIAPDVYAIGATTIHSEGYYVPSALIGSWSTPGLRVEFLSVLEPGFDVGRLKGKIVIVGESSKAGKDSFETPLYGRRGLMSGPEIHAAGVAALLEGRAVSSLAASRQWALNLLVTLLTLAVMMHGRPAWSVPAVLVLAVGVFAGSLLLLTREHTWVRFVSTEAALLLAVPVALGYRYLHESQQERRLRELFGRYVSAEVLHEVLRHPEQVVIEGQERTASVLFTDIRGFTSTSAGAPPREVIAWLNDYFAEMSVVIRRNGGFLNKFIGDGLMVVFGVPVTDGEQKDAERAVRTALEMVARLDTLNLENRRREAAGEWRPPIRIGLGIHTGRVAAGSVGSPERMEFSVIGETVNLAARLESATRHFDVDIVISPATQRLVADRFVTEPLGKADAKGFSERVEVYTVRGEKP